MEGLPGEIKCMFFSQFHPITGPMISCQVPESFDPLRDIFDEVHDLIITKPQLYDRLISIEVGEYRIMGCPKCIDDKKYERNAFIFNFVFVFSSSIDTSAYVPVIQKMGNAFRTYELESSFLSGDSCSQVLPDILKNIRSNLNSCGFCNIRIDDTNKLNLKITPYLQEPPTIEDYHVPIFTCTKEDIHNTTWDLTIEQILPFINGFSHVKKIAMESEVDIGTVRMCVQHLVLYGFLKMISIFQFSNVYVTLPKLQELLTNIELQQECQDYVALERAPPSIANIFRLYSSLVAGLTVTDLCLHNNPLSMGINEKMLIQYGLMRGLIRQLRKYPVFVESEDSEPHTENVYQLMPYMDGSHSYDEICCRLHISSQELDSLVESSMNLLVCWK